MIIAACSAHRLLAAHDRDELIHRIGETYKGVYGVRPQIANLSTKSDEQLAECLECLYGMIEFTADTDELDHDLDHEFEHELQLVI